MQRATFSIATMSRRMTRAAADSMASSSTQLPSSNYIAPSTLMYINSQCNHPAFNKLYLGPNLSQNGKLIGGASAVPKPPKPPEKPLMPYLRYSKKVWDDVKASEPDLRLSQIGKMIGKRWNELAATDKQIYVDEYETEKAEYQKLLKSYHNSPAYQGYLQAKGRAEAIELENKASERDDSIMSIEPADDGSGDTDEGFSVKHVSAARFQRNHRLMQNILLDAAIVPSSRGIVTEQRLDVLRNQVQSLERHQKKLETELIDIEKNHSETKRKWQDSTSNFLVELKRLRSLTPQEYYSQYKKKQQAIKQQQALAETENKELADKESNIDKAAKSSNEASATNNATTENEAKQTAPDVKISIEDGSAEASDNISNIEQPSQPKVEKMETEQVTNDANLQKDVLPEKPAADTPVVAAAQVNDLADNQKLPSEQLIKSEIKE